MVDKVSPGIVSSRITTSSNTIQLAISQHVALLCQALAFTIALYVVAFIKAWLLTLVASASLPFILIGMSNLNEAVHISTLQPLEFQSRCSE
jgi:ATP-binding cassette subfamily B (MDR/TAP) protein 1